MKASSRQSERLHVTTDGNKVRGLQLKRLHGKNQQKPMEKSPLSLLGASKKLAECSIDVRRFDRIARVRFDVDLFDLGYSLE